MNNICIVGLGLIGGSYAMALKAAGKTVTAIDINEASISYALKANIIDDGKTADYAELLQNADTIVLALYPHTLIEWVRDNMQFFKSGAIITDVTGVKCGIVDEVQQLLRKDLTFIACHPMAGREMSGVEYSNPDMFIGANFIITPTKLNDESSIVFARELAATLGFAHISVLSCEEHDRMIGYVSQLTHAIAVSLMNASDNTHLAEYTGDSFRDLTRIASINENMWSELFLMNKDVLTDEIDLFVDAIENLKSKLINNDKDGLQQLFIKSTKRRASFNKL
ncbi:MAG: prephenate dehydrogenase [Oscillospiraceae bacterium]